MEHNVEDVTLENFSSIYKIIMSYTVFESLLFRDFGLNFRSFIDLLNYITVFLLAAGFILWHILTFQQNFIEVMLQVAVMFTVFCLLVRIVTVTIYRKDIVALTSVNFHDFYCNQKRPNSSLASLKQSYVYLKKLNSVMKKNFFLFLSFFYVTPAIFSKSFVGLLNGSNGLEEFLRALPTTFPKRDISTTVHMLSWTYHMIIGLIFMSIWMTLTVLCFGVTILLKKQYQILSNSLLRHHESRLQLKEFVHDHVKLIRITNILRDILGPIVGAQMVQAILITASGAYIAAKPTADSGQFTANFVAYSILSLIELLAFCWQSHVANQANESLGLVIYEFSLKAPNLTDAKDWFLPILMSQKTIKYKALGLVEINLETFLVVLQASYSYYTLMQAKT